MTKDIDQNLFDMECVARDCITGLAGVVWEKKLVSSEFNISTSMDGEDLTAPSKTVTQNYPLKLAVHGTRLSIVYLITTGSPRLPSMGLSYPRWPNSTRFIGKRSTVCAEKPKTTRGGMTGHCTIEQKLTFKPP